MPSSEEKSSLYVFPIFFIVFLFSWFFLSSSDTLVKTFSQTFSAPAPSVANVEEDANLQQLIRQQGLANEKRLFDQDFASSAVKWAGKNPPKTFFSKTPRLSFINYS